MATAKWTGIVVCAALCLGAGAGHANVLTYTISSPLKPATAGQCAATDADDDCLDDNMEATLANFVSPYYLWDESEACNWYSTVDSDSAHGATAGQSHDQPRFYYQVRPILQGYPNISGWYPNDGWNHWVRIKFFLNYPRDCTGHQGDNEMVYYDLYSSNLTTWAIWTGYTARHTNNPDPQATGDFLYSMAQAAGVNYPIQLADRNGHGSWFGKAATSDWCSDTSQGNTFPPNYYCTTGTSIINAIQLGNYVYPATTRNIGEPTISGSNGHWNSSVLFVNGSEAYSVETTGDYVVGGVAQGLPEYWSNKAGTSMSQFCGWQCSSRSTSGNCNINIHGNGTDCTTPLWNKVSQAPFVK